MRIHSSSIVHPKAQLAEDVEVQPFTIIDEDVRIGPGTVVGPHCVITGHTVIGAKNHIYSGAQIGVLSQDLKQRAGMTGKVVIGDGNAIREFVTISASALYGPEDEDKPEKITSIGDSCLFMAYSHVAHDCQVGDGVIMANSVALSGHVEVQDWAIIGGLSGVHQFCIIGVNAFIGGMSRISKDVPPFMIVEGNPSRCHGPNLVGLERNGFDKEARARIKQMYKLLYRSGLNTSQAIEEIEDGIKDCEERRILLSFVRQSERGLTK